MESVFDLMAFLARLAKKSVKIDSDPIRLETTRTGEVYSAAVLRRSTIIAAIRLVVFPAKQAV
jgi:hypothetical protein